MSHKTIALNSFTPSSNPTIVAGQFIDGTVNNRPVVLDRIKGNVKPAVGTPVKLSFGTGRVVGYTPSALRVEVTDFNDDFEFITADESDIFDAEGYVHSLNRCVIRNIEDKRRTFTRVHKSDVTGKLSKTNAERMEESFPMPGSTEVHVLLDANYPFPADTQVWVTELPTEKERKQDAEKRRALELKEALRLKRALLAKFDDDDAPDDVADDIADAFGE